MVIDTAQGGETGGTLAGKAKKTHTSRTVKNRYNKKAYKQVATQVKPELADRIQAYSLCSHPEPCESFA